MLTIDQVKNMIPTNKEPEVWHSLCVEFFEKYEINTVNRIAGFFSQGGHESSDFKTLNENLNYSWEGLRRTFPRYFPTDAIAKEHARNPQKIANRVYDDANRVNKLGNTQVGDGWRFRGRGIFQLTGRFNYDKFGKSVGMTAEEASAYCGTKRGAMESACWYWKVNNLNRHADNDNIVSLSRAVNGGDIGMADRKSRYTRNKNILSGYVSNPTSTVNVDRMLGIGSRGEDVKKVQKTFGLVADGIYGNMTANAVRSWQRKKGYTVTGKLSSKETKELIG